MEYNQYLDMVLQRFSRAEEIEINSFNVTSMYEEKFKIRWLATKLKNYSFVSHVDKIDLEDIISYTSECTNYAVKNYKGLPRGIQNGVTSFNVLVSANVTEAAKKFATSRPKKHFSLFEMPIIYDLASREIYYYKGTPIWGSIYYKYFREYIENHFDVTVDS